MTPYGLWHAWNRWRRQLAVRWSDLGEPPERLVLIVCNPRSGSTWLCDALRCHPAIELHPRYTVFAALGCVGRRYPLDLACAAAGAPRFEVELGRWAGVPAFSCAPGQVPEMVLQAPYAIEKLHPHFFGCDERAFLARLSALERRTRVEMVYLTRAPAAALGSFRSYQRRNPKWNAQISAGQAPRHLRRIYESLLRTAERRPGLVVDYDDLERRFAPTVGAILARLWPPAPPASAALLAAMARATERSERLQTAPRFLNGQPQSGARPTLELRESGRDELARCERAYRGLLALRAAGGA